MACARPLRSAALPALLALGLAACSSTPQRPETIEIGARAAEHALRMVGTPYRYGGNSPRGFDCSGLVQYSYARAGARLPRSTQAQRARSHPVSRRQLRRGDLLFFDQEGSRASHVGIYLGNGRFVHAPSSGKAVHVADFSDPYWRRHFHEARRPLVD